jgi:hypothetical protein
MTPFYFIVEMGGLWTFSTYGEAQEFWRELLAQWGR